MRVMVDCRWLCARSHHQYHRASLDPVVCEGHKGMFRQAALTIIAQKPMKTMEEQV